MPQKRTYSRPQVTVYKPEPLLFENKDIYGCRQCREDVALLDATADFSVLAFRGSEPRPNGNYFSHLGLSDLEIEYLREHLADAVFLLVEAPRGTLLLNTAPLSHTDHLLAVRLHLPKEVKSKQGYASVCHVANTALQGFEIHPHTAPTARAQAGLPLMLIQAQLLELLPYILVFAEEPFARGMGSTVRLIATFAGVPSGQLKQFTGFDLPADRTDRFSLLEALLCHSLALRLGKESRLEDYLPAKPTEALL